MPDQMQRTTALKMAIVARQMRAHFDEAVAELGTTSSQWRVIVVIASSPGATQRLVAEKLEISEVSAGRLIDRLVTEGFVERRRKEEDRRAHAVFLTSKGEALTDRLADLGKTSEKTAFAGLSREEIAAFDATLDRIAANINAPT